MWKEFQLDFIYKMAKKKEMEIEANMKTLNEVQLNFGRGRVSLFRELHFHREMRFEEKIIFSFFSQSLSKASISSIEKSF